MTFLRHIVIALVHANCIASSHWTICNSLSTLLSSFYHILWLFHSAVRDLWFWPMFGISIITCVFIGISISHFMVVLNLINIIIVLIIRLNTSNSTNTSTTINRIVNAASVRMLWNLINLLIWPVSTIIDCIWFHTTHVLLMVNVIFYLVHQIVIILQALHILKIGQISLMMYVDVSIVIVDNYDSSTHWWVLLYLRLILINSILIHIHYVLL